MSLPTVAIVGRPNVGKSSLFNRFLRERKAVVDAQSGVTRDRHYGTCDWNGVHFSLVDTGGIVPNTKDEMEQAISDQADFAINEADLVLLVVDVQVGIDRTDARLAQLLLKTEKNVLLVTNKADDDNLTNRAFEFLRLGLGDPLPVSATSGLRVGDLLDEIVRRLPPPIVDADQENIIRVALVGRPNVGKSSFINQLIGKNRLIVSSKAGTTRDAVDTMFEKDGQKYTLIDTAGLRRKYKVHENIEFYTYLRTTRAIENCSVAVILIDGSEGLTAQDQRVLGEVMEKRRAGIIAVNKWDLVEKDSMTSEKITRRINDSLGKYSFLPIIYISALTGQRVSKVMSIVDEVYLEYNRKITTSTLNEFLERAFMRRKPPARKGKMIKIKYVTQSETAPPTFLFFANHPELIDRAYLQYLSNQLRSEFGFQGAPIRIKCRQK